jgi:hypothetical protein
MTTVTGGSSPRQGRSGRHARRRPVDAVPGTQGAGERGMTDLDLDLHIVLTDRISGLQHRYPPAEWVGYSHGAMLAYASAAVADAWRLARSAADAALANALAADAETTAALAAWAAAIALA